MIAKGCETALSRWMCTRGAIPIVLSSLMQNVVEKSNCRLSI